MELKLDQKTIFNGIGAVLGGYILYHWTGGEPLPLLKDFTPWVAGIVGAIALWKHLNK